MVHRCFVPVKRALAAGGAVVSIIPSDDIHTQNRPCTVLIPCGMGDARNLLMALSGDACLVIGGRAGTISEVWLAWLHRRPLLPLVGCGGRQTSWSATRPTNAGTHPPYSGIPSKYWKHGGVPWI